MKKKKSTKQSETKKKKHSKECLILSFFSLSHLMKKPPKVSCD